MPDTVPLQPPTIDLETSDQNAATEPSMMDTFSESYDKIASGDLTEATSLLVMKVVLPGVAALAMLIVAYFVAKLLSRWISNSVRKRVDETLGKFAGRLVFYTIMVMSLIAVLQTIGVGVTSFAAVVAAVGFAVGLAFQGTLSNFSSGILLLVFRPFEVGDVVNTAGITGKVNAIDLFTTTFDTPDNRRLIVPNSSITGATIENITFHDVRRVEVAIGVVYTASLDTTREILTDCAESFTDVTIQGEGRGYQVILSNLGASSVDWVVRLWVAKENFFAVKEALTEEIKIQLDEQGIGIPFPQMELHFAPENMPRDNTAEAEAGEEAAAAMQSSASSHLPMDTVANREKNMLETRRYDLPHSESPAPASEKMRTRPRMRSRG